MDFLYNMCLKIKISILWKITLKDFDREWGEIPLPDVDTENTDSFYFNYYGEINLEITWWFVSELYMVHKKYLMDEIILMTVS